MKIDITIAHADGIDEPWIENYDRAEVKTIADANEYATALINNWNRTLRPHEKARRVVLVELRGKSGSTAHDWEKVNLVTLLDDRMSPHDILRCANCMVTAKRYGLTNIIIDRKFRAKKYQGCVKK
jgi:hypothetical protein